MGKIGVLVSVKTNIDFSLISNFLKKISMHVAAANPISITPSDIDDDILEKEKAFQLEEIKKSGKDQSIQEKMLEGKMNKYFKDVVLLKQNFYGPLWEFLKETSQVSMGCGKYEKT